MSFLMIVLPLPNLSHTRLEAPERELLAMYGHLAENSFIADDLSAGVPAACSSVQPDSLQIGFQVVG